MSMQLRAFRPLAPTQNIAVTATAQSFPLPNIVGTIYAVRFANLGTQTVFIALEGVTATVNNGIPLPAGAVETFTLDSQSSISVIATATGSTLYATVGEGV